MYAISACYVQVKFLGAQLFKKIISLIKWWHLPESKITTTTTDRWIFKYLSQTTNDLCVFEKVVKWWL